MSLRDPNVASKKTPKRIARRYAGPLGLSIFEAPLPLRPYALGLVWHPRLDADPAHRFLREALLRAAEEVAGERHDAPRTRLDPSDPTSGQARRRARRPARLHTAKQ